MRRLFHQGGGTRARRRRGLIRRTVRASRCNGGTTDEAATKQSHHVDLDKCRRAGAPSSYAVAATAPEAVPSATQCVPQVRPVAAAWWVPQ